MKIVTAHTVAFTFVSPSQKAREAAHLIVRVGADNLPGLVLQGIDPQPMPTNADPASFRDGARISGDDEETLRGYCSRVQDSLEWIGVEVLP